MSEWKEYKLGEITTEIGDGLHGTPKYSENGEYYFINGNNISKGKVIIKADTKKVDQTEFEKYKKTLSDRTLLMSINGTIGNVGLYNNEKCVLGKSACYFNLKDNVDKHFVYYTFMTEDFQSYLLNIATGTTIQNVPLKGLRDSIVLLPPLDIQRRIASILTSLDDKIDLLRRENATLEAMAETLFRQWFVEEEKDDWWERMLGDFFDVKTGKRDANYSVENGSFPFFTCSKQTLSAPSYSFEGSAILLAGNGDFNVKRYVGKFEAYQRTYVLIPYEVKYFNLLYIVIKYYLDEITGGHRGSVISFITKGMITDFTVRFPMEDIDNKLKQFDVIFERVDANINQIQTLIQTRDGLLPKLMDGEIKV